MAIDELRLHQLAISRRAEGPKAAEPQTSLAEASTRSPTALVTSTTSSLSVAPIPVDVERVAQIRRAVENGTYPLVPARIADAMIAAGMLLSMPRNDQGALARNWTGSST